MSAMESSMYIIRNGTAQKLHLRHGRLCYVDNGKDMWYVDGLDLPIYTEAEMLEKYPELMV